MGLGEGLSRSPLQGVRTVVALNWPTFGLALLAPAGALALGMGLGWPLAPVVAAAAFALLPTVGALVATHVAYDRSDLYRLEHLVPLLGAHKRVALLTAGFDEVSGAVEALGPEIDLRIFDVLDDRAQTTPSIRRARAWYRSLRPAVPAPGGRLPAPAQSFEVVLAFMSAHELRSAEDRARLFREVHRVLTPDGRLVVVEHLRDWANGLAYLQGAFHFHSRKTWVDAFASAGLAIEAEHAHSLFVRRFVLKRA